MDQNDKNKIISTNCILNEMETHGEESNAVPSYSCLTMGIFPPHGNYNRCCFPFFIYHMINMYKNCIDVDHNQISNQSVCVGSI